MPEFDFKSKLGPLPVWVWGAIAGVIALIGYLVYMRFNSAGSSSATPNAAGSSIDPMGYQTSGIKGGYATTETTVPDNNVTWLNRVSRAVSDALAASPSEVYNALLKYITGQAITEKEKAYVDKGLQIGMNPPDGTQGVSDVQKEQPPQIYSNNPVGVIRRSGSGDLALLAADRTKRLLSVAEWQRMGSPNPNALSDREYDSFRIVG